MGTITTFPAVTPAVPNNGTFLAYAQVVADQAGIVGLADLTGLSVTVNVPAGRRLRITGHVGQFNRTAGTATWSEIDVWEGATKLGQSTQANPNTYTGVDIAVIVSPSAGVHTYNLKSNGDGTYTMTGSAQNPAWILVEDITNSPVPYPPASVPVGQLGYASISSTQAGITASNPGTPITGLSVNVTVPAGRTLKVTVNGYAWNSTGNTQTNVRTMMDGAQIKEAADREDTANTANTIHSEVIVSPSAGAHTFSVNVSADSGGSITFGGVPAFILVEDITPTPAPANSAPSSTLGYAEITADPAISATAGTTVDIPGLSVTVTVPAGRRLRIVGKFIGYANTLPARVASTIREGSTVLGNFEAQPTAAGMGVGLHAEAIISPSAGTHTYKVSVTAATNTGYVYVDANLHGWILVEDITAVSTYAINPLAVMPGTFQAGVYNIPDQLVIGGGDAPADIYHRLTLVAPSAGADLNFTLKEPGAASATNLYWMFSRYGTSSDNFELRGWDGTTAKGFIYCDYANGRMYLQDKPLRIRSVGDGAHGLQYTATLIDGPLLYGNSGAALGDVNNGWDFRAMGNGDCYSRGNLTASGGNIVASSTAQVGQGRGAAQARFHFSGDGNDMHHNWGGPYNIYVDVTNVKTFVIPHPTDNERYLVHACVEGPEALVQYRGQSQLEGGWVQVDLPPYFEALCAEEGRSVQLTCIADDPADEWCPVLHATYPKNGKFWVGLGSGMVINDQRFWWEVKAVRKDVPPVNVEPLTNTVDVLGEGPYTYYKEK